VSRLKKRHTDLLRVFAAARAASSSSGTTREEVCVTYQVSASPREVWISGPLGLAARFTASGFEVFGADYRSSGASGFEAWADFSEAVQELLGIEFAANERPLDLF
jgi:hypothetical protein